MMIAASWSCAHAHTRLRKRITIRAVLVFGVSRTESENEPSASKKLQRGRQLRGQGRISVSLSEDRCAPALPRMLAGVIREEGQATITPAMRQACWRRVVARAARGLRNDRASNGTTTTPP